MSFPRYPKCKASGVEWLGDVPDHWKAVPIKHLGRLKGGAGFPHDRQGVAGEELSFHKVNALAQADSNGFLVQSENTIDRLTAKELGAFIFPSNSIVFAKVGAALFLGRIRLLSQNACLDNNMMGLVVHQSQHQVKFVRHAMSLVRFDLIANPGAVPSLNEGQIGNFRIAIPPLPEQTSIAEFLDRETAKIDGLVAEQRRLIELLKEKRQAVISHAVTKGLNPRAPLKPSGIEWLGDVPDHWEVRRLKFLCDIQTGGKDTENAVEDGLYPFFVRSQTVERINSMAFDCEAVLTAGDGVGVGRVFHYYHGPFDFHQRVYMMNNFREVSGRFLFHFLRENFYKVALEGGAKSTVDSLRRPVFMNFPVCVPPNVEQEAIVHSLEQQAEKFDALTAEAERVIELLQERRTALISAAVTGQIDVRQQTRN